MRPCHVPQLIQGSWQPAPRSVPSLAANPESVNDLGFAPRPVAPYQNPGIVAITEEWGDQPSWKAVGDLGALLFSFSNTGRLSPPYDTKLSLLVRWLITLYSIGAHP
jgi:hypothetical protein